MSHRPRTLRVLLTALAAVLLCAATAVTVGVTSASGHPADATDVDHDLLKNDFDNCPGNYNPKQQDNDKDSEVQSDTLPPTELPNNGGTIGGPMYGWVESQSLPDGSADPRNRPIGVGGDACDEDDDNDGFPDKRTSKPQYVGKAKDNCKLVPNPKQEDAESDGIGDVCDTDDDNDAVLDTADNCPLVSNVDQRDADGDKTGDACDPDAPKGTGSLAGRDPNDKTAPAATVRVARKQLFSELGLGLAVFVRCSEGCQIEGELRAGKQLLGRGAAQIEDKGFTFVFVKLSKATMTRIQRRPKVGATLRVLAKDANGNATRVSRRLNLRR